jgi:glyceraldehyde 3-phosphate dehydrogenase
MESAAVRALGALAQESRLEVFRALARVAPEGLAAGTLADELGVPPSTLSFHLDHLLNAGLVRRERDGRSLVYSLDVGAVNELIWFVGEDACQGNVALAVDPLARIRERVDAAKAPAGRPRVLFLCSRNSARSQMAEAILRREAGDRFEVHSCGLRPAPIDPLTLRVIEEAGLDVSPLRSKDLGDFLGKLSIHHAIIVCEAANDHCPKLHPFALHLHHWPFPDPVEVEGTGDERLAAFRGGARRDRGADSRLAPGGAAVHLHPLGQEERMRVGINGFGRMGRLVMRAAWDREDLDVVAVNEPSATVDTMALLLEFDSVQGRWDRACSGATDALVVDGERVAWSSHRSPVEIPWRELGVELVLECSGRFRRSATLTPHLERGASRVVVSAPVKDGPPNIVVGVNHDAFDLAAEPVVTAASCTTNCLAPLVRVLQDGIGVVRGSVTTIHDPTNSQRVVDAPHEDPRRARSALVNLVPTTTNSATAVTLIVPELAGKLDSVAIRAPVLNASIVDGVFQVERHTTVEEVNGLFEAASRSERLRGILGYETRPLVSSDYARDPRSGVVDALSTRVTDARLVKVLAWYDNEWGYANRLAELAGLVAASAGAPARGASA